jgi:hypothetical protein
MVMADGTCRYIPQQKWWLFFWVNIGGHFCNGVYTSSEQAEKAVKKHFEYYNALFVVREEVVAETKYTKLVCRTHNNGSSHYVPYRKAFIGWKHCTGPRLVNGCEVDSHHAYFSWRSEAQEVLDYWLSKHYIKVMYAPVVLKMDEK